MAAHGLKRARPAALVPGTVCVITARMDYLPRSARPTGWRPGRGRGCTTRSAPWCRCTPGARLSQGAAPAAAASGRPAGGRGGPAGPPRVHRFGAGAGSGTGHAAPAWAGVASTRWPWHARRGRCSSWARSSSTWRCRRMSRPARTAAVQRLHRRLPHAGHRRALPAGRAALHQLPDHRTCRRHRPGTAPAHRQPHLRLRRLPARLPLEQVRAAQPRCPTSTNAQGLADATLLRCGHWSEADFLQRTEGSPIRRIGWTRWRRNLAVALGNAWRATGMRPWRRRCAKPGHGLTRWCASTSTGRWPSAPAQG
jgi:epoxyqueuosine reductase